MSSNAAGIQPTQAIHPPSPQWLCYVQTALAASAEPAHGNGGARRAASGVAICAAGAAACIFNCYYMKDRFRCGMSAPSRQEWCRRRSILPRLRKQRKRVKSRLPRFSWPGCPSPALQPTRASPYIHTCGREAHGKKTLCQRTATIPHTGTAN